MTVGRWQHNTNSHCVIVDTLNVFLPHMPRDWQSVDTFLFDFFEIFLQACDNSHIIPFFVLDLAKSARTSRRTWITRQSRLAVSDNRRFPSCSALLIGDVLFSLSKKRGVYWTYVLDGETDNFIASLADRSRGTILSCDRDFLRYTNLSYTVAVKHVIEYNRNVPTVRLIPKPCRPILYQPPNVDFEKCEIDMHHDRFKNDVDTLLGGHVYRGVIHPHFRVVPHQYEYLLPVYAMLYVLHKIECIDHVIYAKDEKPFYVWNQHNPVIEVELLDATDVRYKNYIECRDLGFDLTRLCKLMAQVYVDDLHSYSSSIDTQDINNIAFAFVLKCSDVVMMHEYMSLNMSLDMSQIPERGSLMETCRLTFGDIMKSVNFSRGLAKTNCWEHY